LSVSVFEFINNQRPNKRGQSGRHTIEATYCTDKISFSFHNVIICQFPFLNGALCLSESNDSAKHKFKQIRFIEWIKTNPQPLNSSVNYLTNCREIALLGIKGTKPTFNSKYDNGIYMFPLQGGKNRFHPTQKSLSLFEELITKHSNENDVVLDTFLGGGTTAIASKNTKRKFKGCEISTEYFDKVMKLI